MTEEGACTRCGALKDTGNAAFRRGDWRAAVKAYAQGAALAAEVLARVYRLVDDGTSLQLHPAAPTLCGSLCNVPLAQLASVMRPSAKMPKFQTNRGHDDSMDDGDVDVSHADYNDADGMGLLSPHDSTYAQNATAKMVAPIQNTTEIALFEKEQEKI